VTRPFGPSAGKDSVLAARDHSPRPSHGTWRTPRRASWSGRTTATSRRRVRGNDTLPGGRRPWQWIRYLA
jgi:hypothetical protein